MAKRWLYVKVKWEGTNVAKVIRVQTGEKKGDSMGRFLLPEEYSYLLGEIDKISLYEGKRLVCIDKEGDEVSECMNVVGRVPVASNVFL